MGTLHYTSGGSATDISRAGFNLVDVQSVEELNDLPDGMMGLVWLDEVDGVTSSFKNKVDPFIGNDKLFGFYLADEPDPTGQWGVFATAENLKAELDYIHDNVPGAKTFITMMNMGYSAEPDFQNTFNPENTGIDYYGVNAYPVRSDPGPIDYDMIDRMVTAAVDFGVPVDQIVPVYQTFGGGDYMTDTDSKHVLPTAEQMQIMVDRWEKAVPSPAFDYAYAWGSQLGTTTIADLQELQDVFLQHNTASHAPDDFAGTDTTVGMNGTDVTNGPDGHGTDHGDQPGDQVADASGDGSDDGSMSGSHDLNPGSDAGSPATDDGAGAEPTDPTGSEPGQGGTGNHGNHGDHSHGWKGAGHWTSGGRGHEKWHKSNDATAEDGSHGKGHRGHSDAEHKHGSGHHAEKTASDAGTSTVDPADTGNAGAHHGNGGGWHQKGGAVADASSAAPGAKHVDKFIDFNSKHDTIDWGSGHFKSLTKSGSHGGSDFAAGTHAQAQGAGHCGAYANDTGTFHYDADGTGAGDAHFADLTHHSSATAADFVIA